jgi:hypothetical protein
VCVWSEKRQNDRHALDGTPVRNNALELDETGKLQSAHRRRASCLLFSLPMVQFTSVGPKVCQKRLNWSAGTFFFRRKPANLS